MNQVTRVNKIKKINEIGHFSIAVADAERCRWAGYTRTGGETSRGGKWEEP